MTKSIALKDGDIYLDKYGNLAIVTGLDACEQNCKTAMLAVQGEMIYALQGGIPYRSVVWDRYTPALFEMYAREILLSVKDVKSVASFTQNMTDGILSYEAKIVTIYGNGMVTG